MTVGVVLTAVGFVVSAGVLAIVARIAVGRRLAQVRAETASAPRAEQAHALRLASVTVIRTSVLLAVALAVAAEVTIGGQDQDRAAKAVGYATAFAASLILVLVPRQRIQREYAALRGVPVRSTSRSRSFAVQLLLLGLLALGATAGWAIHPPAGATRGIAVALGLGVGFIAVAVLGGPLVLVANGYERPPDDLARRVHGLAASVGVGRLRLVVLPDTGRKIANAYAAGFVPGLRYLVVTRFLLDNLTAEQVDAVVAHELGHFRRRHVLVRTAAQGALFVPYAVLIGAIYGDQIPVLAASTAAGGWALALVGVRRWVSLRQELAADDVAAALVGADELAGALTALGHLNDVPENTSDRWNRRVGHPGLRERIVRLRSFSTAAGSLSTMTTPAGRHR